MAKPALTIAIVLTLMILSSILAIHVLIEQRIGPRVDSFREEQHAHLKEYLEDESNAEKDSVFERPTTENADAGPYLNPRLRWAPLPAGVRPAGKDVIEFPEDWREDIFGSTGRWIRLFFRYNPKKIDFSLFTELRKYDHWRLDENSPISDVMAHDSFPNSIAIPLPNTTDLNLFARLYLMRAVDTDDALQSLQDVRHLARLLMSTEHSETEMSGIALLKTERHAYTYFVRHGYIDENEWSPISEESVLRAQRVYLAERTYLHLWTPAPVLDVVFMEHPALGLCATVNDAVSDDWSLTGMLRPRLWPEEDLNAPYEQLAKVAAYAARHGCRLTFLKAKMAQNRFPFDAGVPWYAMYLPFVRRLFALDFTTLPPAGFALPPSTDSN